MERNIWLYEVYAGLFNAFFWMPLFFLYFSEHVSLAQVLALEVIYYLAVVGLEVPSGYFSDRVGRRATLVASALALAAAYAAFFLGESFGVFALAQVLLAAGIAFNSGTDTSFHYDSLAALGREDEYDEREARVARTSLTATGAAALIGGAVGAWDLGAAYGLSAAAALVSVGVVWRFREPPHTGRAAGFASQLGACVGHLRRPALRWFFGYAVLLVTLNHVPYEFYQPYLALVGDGVGLEGAPSLAAGVHMASATLLGAWFARRSARFARWAGTARALLAAAAVQIMVILVMGAALHPAIVAVILLRGAPGALARAPLNAAVVPRVPQAQRATYLSLQSLAGRLGFAALLGAMALVAPDAPRATWAALSPLLLAAGALGALGWLALLAARGRA